MRLFLGIGFYRRLIDRRPHICADSHLRGDPVPKGNKILLRKDFIKSRTNGHAVFFAQDAVSRQIEKKLPVPILDEQDTPSILAKKTEGRSIGESLSTTIRAPFRPGNMSAISETLPRGNNEMPKRIVVFIATGWFLIGAVTASVFAKETWPVAGLTSAKALMHRMDKNRDHRVSKDEFMHFMQDEFERLDQKKDGLLTVEELSQLIVGDGGKPDRRAERTERH